MKRIVLYSVPDPTGLVSGPAVRVANMTRAFRARGESQTISGSAWKKIRGVLRSRYSDITYVESSTSRLTLVDICCLVVLRLRSKAMMVYIRDIYFDMFPEDYGTAKGRVRCVLHALSNHLYVLFADKLAFPTRRMAERYLSRYGAAKGIEWTTVPPGTFRPSGVPPVQELAAQRLKRIRLLYIGGIGYRFSGIDNLLTFVQHTVMPVEMVIVSRDAQLNSMIDRMPEEARAKTSIVSADFHECVQLMLEGGITFALHPRPRNIYDDVTYPIKIFDYLSCLVPVITDRHEPLEALLHSSYPMFVDIEKVREIEYMIERWSQRGRYMELLERVEEIREANTYDVRVESIAQSFN